MRSALWWKTFRDAKASVGGVAFALFAIAALVAGLYPMYRDQLTDELFPEELRRFFGDVASIATPEGYYVSQHFAYASMLAAIVGLIAGSAAVAGEEAAGTLDLLLAQPVRRSRLLLEKAAGIGVGIAAAALGSLLGFLVLAPWVDVGLHLGPIAAAHLHMVHQAALFSAVAISGSAWLPTRAQAGLAGAAVMVAAWVAVGLGATIEALSALRDVSPFGWVDYEAVLRGDSWEWRGVVLDVVLTAALLALACWGFERRDIVAGPRETGGWRRYLVAGRIRGNETSSESPAAIREHPR
ncbi:hypothetical protein HRbin29_02050 [bacterium HR29]|nr:hypothetical protein HRbin29_02050 [bacterium HR29]